MLQVIVAAGADVTVRARGTFFHPADQQNSCPPEDSNYEVGKREDEDDDSVEDDELFCFNFLKAILFGAFFKTSPKHRIVKEKARCFT